ncbi:MAG: pantetheine-phosphate adenylyltransferase [Coriobacteriales bacterium]|jgi:pantetheine-phosphate adenylyltransferase|nr:pantetheine-phosphate adenylyltransferase [Coriobacteriales bacterium]
MPVALIPGTYDPITLGHLDVIERSAQIFRYIYVGVAASAKKGGGPLFSLAERLKFATLAVAHLNNVEVVSFTGLLVDFASAINADAIVKGLRAVTDFESEFQQASLNYHLKPDLETVFIMATPQHMYLSSSMVKEIASLGGDISGWVTEPVQEALRKKLRPS